MEHPAAQHGVTGISGGLPACKRRNIKVADQIDNRADSGRQKIHSSCIH